MKKIKFLLAFTSLFFMYALAFSHGTCTNRNSCSWTWGVPWQYKAHVRVSKFGVPSYSTDKDCPYVNGDGYAHAYRNNGCAWQSASNYYGSWSFSGSVYKMPRFCARGEIYSDLYYDLMNNRSDVDGYEASELKTEGTRFEKGVVYLNGITGFLLTKGEDVFSSFEVIMWLPCDENDTIIKEEKIFYRGKIELVNGKVKITGDFPKDSYKLYKTNAGEYKVEFSGVNIKANLPDGIDVDSDIIEVVGISDGGVIEKNIINKKIVEDINKNVLIYPNPTDGKITVSLNTDDESDYEVKIYDVNGKELKVLAKGINFINQNQYTFNLSDFKMEKGVYFILLKSETNTYIKKVILK